MSERTNVQLEPFALDGGTVVTPERTLSAGSVLVRGEEIVAVDRGRVAAERRIDASERLVLPGFVDIHGDDIEAHLQPRSGADIDPTVALTVCDRLNLAAGVTTKLHAVAFEESPEEQRSIRGAMAVVDAVEEAARLLATHRVHARCELGDAEAVEAVLEVIGRPSVDLVSLMNHVPGRGQYHDVEAFTRAYAADGPWGRNGALSLAGDRRTVDRQTIRDRIDVVIGRAEREGLPVASHDDEDPDRVEALFDRGVDLCEYPTTLAAARRASALGLPVAMGAPNLARGGSLWGNLGVREAIDASAVDVLCSDYHPPSLLHALLVKTGEPLDRRVTRLTAAPAEAVGLEDRGRLEPGHRADIVVVNPGDPPVVERVFVGGVEVYRAVPAARRATVPPQ